MILFGPPVFQINLYGLSQWWGRAYIATGFGIVVYDANTWLVRESALQFGAWPLGWGFNRWIFALMARFGLRRLRVLRRRPLPPR
jgi:hypothetical protein